MTFNFKIILVCIIGLVIFELGNNMYCFADYERAAKKHLAIGNELYKQRRVSEAIAEWKLAKEIDPTLQKASVKIKKAEDYLAKVRERKITLANTATRTEPEDYLAAQEIPARARRKGPVDRIKADILEIERLGGRATKIIIAAGSSVKIRPGLDGIIVEPNGSAVAAFQIKLADSDKSLAEVLGLSRDVSDYAVAIINRPK